jgi:hypothetical protein
MRAELLEMSSAPKLLSTNTSVSRARGSVVGLIGEPIDNEAYPTPSSLHRDIVIVRLTIDQPRLGDWQAVVDVFHEVQVAVPPARARDVWQVPRS